MALIRLIRGRKGTKKRYYANNQILNVIHQRRSCRNYQEAEVPPEIIEKILEAGRYAPTTVNLQTFSFIVFSRGEWLERFDRPLPWMGSHAIMILGDWHKLSLILPELPDAPLAKLSVALVNGALAAENMTLAAYSCDLGSILLMNDNTGLPDLVKIREKLQLPANVFPILTVVIGYPQGSSVAPPRIPQNNTWFWNRYGPIEPSKMQEWLKQLQVGYRLTRGRSLESRLREYQAEFNALEEQLREYTKTN